MSLNNPEEVLDWLKDNPNKPLYDKYGNFWNMNRIQTLSDMNGIQVIGWMEMVILNLGYGVEVTTKYGNKLVIRSDKPIQ